MKQFKFLSALALLAGSFFFSSCNGDQKKENTTAVTTDSSSMATTTAPKMEPPAKPGNILIIRHKVADYAKWKIAYDAHDSTRLAYGLHNNLVARGTKDPNMVMVVLGMDDAAKGKEFTAMPGLKAAMQKGGVVGTPSFLYIDMQFRDTSNSGASRVIVTHKVKDWEAWKKSFDSHKQARVDAGLTDRAVGYGVGDTHTVTAAFIISDKAKAEAFMNSKDLKDKMAEAGVTGPPDIFFYTVVQKY